MEMKKYTSNIVKYFSIPIIETNVEELLIIECTITL